MNIKEKIKAFAVPDRVLFIAALAGFALFILVKFASGGVNSMGRAALVISRNWDEVFGKDTIDALIGEFEDGNRELSIRRETGKTQSDILLFDEGRYPHSGLVSLNAYVHSGDGAERRAIPLVSSMYLLYYNVILLSAAGFDRPPKNRADLLASPQAVTAARSGSGIYGAGLALSPQDPPSIRREVFSRIWASGASLLQEGRPYFGGRAAVETLEFLSRLNPESSPGVFEKTGAELAEEFAEGNIALMIAPAKEISRLRKKTRGPEFGITVIPASAETPAKNGLGLESWYAGISAACARPDEAWSFLAFLAENSSRLAARLEAVPGSVSGLITPAGAIPGPHIQNDPLYAKAWEIYEASEPVEEFPALSGAADCEAILREELAKLFAGSQNPADTAAAIQTRWTAAAP
jgi:multiple sugar transport system substrate-binding protein